MYIIYKYIGDVNGTSTESSSGGIALSSFRYCDCCRRNNKKSENVSNKSAVAQKLAQKNDVPNLLINT
jgi:hypothetical protein